MRTLGRLAAAVGLAGAGVVVGVPAGAEPCSSADGVTVVVDFHELGGGLQQVCDPDGGGELASALFPDNGFPLTYVQQTPGFVCRVSGEPADDPCVNTPPPDAYWGLWWSDGDSGEWTYSSSGVGSLKVPAGGSVAFSWNGSTAKSPPGAPPPQHTSDEESASSEPTPAEESSSPESEGSETHPGPAGTTPGDSATPSAEPSPENGSDPPRAERTTGQRLDSRLVRRDGPRREEAPAPSPTPSPSFEASATPTSDPVENAGGSVPAWVAPTAVGVLFATAGVTAHLRRRAG